MRVKRIYVKILAWAILGFICLPLLVVILQAGGTL